MPEGQNGFDTEGRENQEDSPWKGDEKDFDPPKLVMPATYAFHIWHWEWPDTLDRLILTARIDENNPSNGTEGGRDLRHWFWANSKHILKRFMIDVLGEERYKELGGALRIHRVVDQSLGYPFLCDVIHQPNKAGKLFANLDIETVTAYPDGGVIIPTVDESPTDFPFGANS